MCDFKKFSFTILEEKVVLSGHVFVPVQTTFSSRSDCPIPSTALTKSNVESIQLHSSPLVVLVHQWSKMGGESSLMEGMAVRLATEHRIASLTFDLRGVGASSGRATFAGFEEVKDVVAVCRWAVENLDAKNIFLLGSSAGAPIAGSALDLVDEIIGYIAIGYVFGFIAALIFRGHYEALLQSTKPKLMIHGTADGFTGMAKFGSYFDRMAAPKEKIIVEGVGHFELEQPHHDVMVANVIANFIEKHNEQQK